MGGPRRCSVLFRGAQVSQTGIRYPGLRAGVTSVTSAVSHHPVLQRLWLRPFAAQGLILSQKRLSVIFTDPTHDLRLLSPVTIHCGWSSAQTCPQAVILVYTNISSSLQKRSKNSLTGHNLGNQISKDYMFWQQCFCFILCTSQLEITIFPMLRHLLQYLILLLPRVYIIRANYCYDFFFFNWGKERGRELLDQALGNLI